jgi:hypothetical protein
MVGFTPSRSAVAFAVGLHQLQHRQASAHLDLAASPATMAFSASTSSGSLPGTIYGRDGSHHARIAARLPLWAARSGAKALERWRGHRVLLLPGNRGVRATPPVENIWCKQIHGCSCRESGCALLNIHYALDSNQLPLRSEMTLRANSGCSPWGTSQPIILSQQSSLRSGQYIRRPCNKPHGQETDRIRLSAAATKCLLK